MHYAHSVGEPCGGNMKRNSRAATPVDIFVGVQLKALRKSAKLSQTDLAEKVGITFQQIQKYESGTNRIGASRLWDFCKLFNVKPGYFFQGVEDYIQTTNKQNTKEGDTSLSEMVAPTYAIDLIVAE